MRGITIRPEVPGRKKKLKNKTPITVSLPPLMIRYVNMANPMNDYVSEAIYRATPQMIEMFQPGNYRETRGKKKTTVPFRLFLRKEAAEVLEKIPSRNRSAFVRVCILKLPLWEVLENGDEIMAVPKSELKPNPEKL